VTNGNSQTKLRQGDVRPKASDATHLARQHKGNLHYDDLTHSHGGLGGLPAVIV
jgi:hypothetical protein